MAYRLSGSKHFAITVLVISAFIIVGCDEANCYEEKTMGELAMVAEDAMSVVEGEYDGKAQPARLDEGQIRETYAKAHLSFHKGFDKADLAIVTDGEYLGVVVWDPKSGRKLIQDLNCTDVVDDQPWKNKVYGDQFTLDFGACY